MSPVHGDALGTGQLTARYQIRPSDQRRHTWSRSRSLSGVLQHTTALRFVWNESDGLRTVANRARPSPNRPSMWKVRR